jgi:hypothetical protein
MNRTIRSVRVAALAAVVAGLLAGSAQARGLRLEVPAAKAPAAAQAQTVWIQSVTDKRAFEDRPRAADTPSLAAGVASTKPEVRVTAVGRVRDGYGKARANVFLAPPQTIESLARELVANAFRGAGYTVLADEKAVARDTLKVTVTVDKFWGWVDVAGGGALVGGPGMYMKGDVLTTLAVTAPRQSWTLMICGQASNRLGVGVTGSNWVKMFAALFTDYAANAETVLQKLAAPEGDR